MKAEKSFDNVVNFNYLGRVINHILRTELRAEKTCNSSHYPIWNVLSPSFYVYKKK
jgi:hypothetical protein